MYDVNAFERQVADEARRMAGPSDAVDDAEIFIAITATSSPKWRLQTMFSATKFVAAGVIVALFGGFLLIAQPFAQQGDSVPGATSDGSGAFSPAGSLAEPRDGHTATLLPDGRVLVVGGSDNGLLASAELWDPTTASFSPAGSLAEPRDGHTATLLSDGRVLVVGGLDPEDKLANVLRSAEVWDPATSKFGPTGPLRTARDGHIATLLPDGRVLVAGGSDDELPFRAEVWDPATSKFSPAGSTNNPYDDPTALRDGRILFVALDFESEVWDPGTDTSSAAGMSALGGIESATLLPDGRVLIIGGERFDADRKPFSAEIWDPATASFSPAGAIAQEREGHIATALPDGRVLILGGCDPAQRSVQGLGCQRLVDSAEIWDPKTETFGPTGSPAEADIGTATALPDGRVLVVGGWDPDGGVLASAEVWEPSGG